MSFSISYPPELPVSQMRDDIQAAIRDHQVVIVAGATGSGKTTQLPKICLELGRTSIGHTQPRRLAARTIAERVADELGTDIGQTVGYQVRFTDRVSKDTRIKLMTDGILLNEIHRDRMLRGYDTIIIDEAHERSLNIDFLLGYLKRLLPKRPDLKLIITSATIDPESFSRHFDDAPIIEVSGRTYPVEIRYRPLVADGDGEDEAEDEDDDDAHSSTDERTVVDGITDALDELSRESNGDVLVFLSGEAEIRDAADALRSRYADERGGTTEVLPLYGRLSSADQHKVFQPSQLAGVKRRIVLATNVAETSLTVPGIRYVIDAGTARISRYSVRSKVQRLPIEAISQASANQRSGRSGRTSPGIAIRLYSETDFDRRPEFTEPEILRTNLAAVILQMVSLGLGEITAFPFLQPPDSRGIKDGTDLLTELGALKRASGDDLTLTKIGRDLARLPIDPRFARMVVESKRWSTSREVLAIVAALTIQDPRERPLEKRQQADELHARFTDSTSDFLTLLNLWNYLEGTQRELSSSAFRRMCKREFLNYLRVREWQDVYRQLKRMARPLGLTIGEPAVNPDGIHRSLLAGLLSHIGLKDAAAASARASKSKKSTQGPPKKGDYIGARGTRFVIFPGSALVKKQPTAIMSAELVETSRLFARTNAAIDPAWAEKIAGDLCKRTYSEPHWEKKQGAVVAYEKVTLFGVPIVPRRRMQYARVDAALCRELFIRHALVEGEWDSPQRFDEANTALRHELAQVEERTRRRDILFDDEAVFEFYDARIPSDVVSTRTFEGWWRKTRQSTPDLLTMRPDDLLPQDVATVDETAFPPTWRQGDQTLSLSYRFEPGSDDDGVTVTVPLALLPRLSPAGFDWQVPGLRHELVTALIKSLPKALRRNIVPAADWASKLLDELPEAPPEPESTDADTLTASLAIAVKRLAYMPIEASDFDIDRVPAHLTMTFRVVDEKGRHVASSKDLRRLQKRLGSRMRASVARAATTHAPNRMERSGLTTWDLDELPRYIDTTQPAGVIRGYPALVDDGNSVSIRIHASETDQRRAMPGGIRRLLTLATPNPASYVQSHLTAAEKLTLGASPYPSTQKLFDDCLLAVIDDVLVRMHPDRMMFSKAQFEAVRDRVSASVMDAMFDTVSLTARTLAAARDAQKALSRATSMTVLPAISDAKAQLDGLVFDGFVSRTGREQLQHLPRYLAAIAYRAQKLPDSPNRDRTWMLDVQRAAEKFEKAGGSIPLSPDAPARIVQARWMLEELRVSMFAQHLGTAYTVSPQRIQKVLAG
ncbi:ATP-dependent RNA helicase HrpA [Microbacterium sp. MPKO10]|uniref:ATP-dependent RNA helicase HrpA n=1 Tax=Microbacterium sp. MPKO10 TaxID=2989818 RepID=UPI0022366FDA|nr:ATP-dependent RNA helicase HrpA [Microbacterium sp. MPKO10]MCW4458468.1 ATP-dependent RNA helicase HrpA [Microbacterium sp. MPKO10]